MIYTTFVKDVPFCPDCERCGASLPFVGCPHSDADGVPCETRPIPARFKTSVEREIAYAYMQYPTLYGRTPWARLYILEHLFVTNGNGYGWHDGRLVDQCGPMRKKLAWRTAEAELEREAAGRPGREYYSDQLRHEALKTLDFDAPGAWDRYNELSDRTFSDAELIASIEQAWTRERPYFPTYFYPLCEYADLYQIDKTARKAWLAAAWDAFVLTWLIQDNSYDGEHGARMKRGSMMRDYKKGDPMPDMPAHTHGGNLEHITPLFLRLVDLDTNEANRKRLADYIWIAKHRDMLIRQKGAYNDGSPYMTFDGHTKRPDPQLVAEIRAESARDIGRVIGTLLKGMI